MLKRHENTTPFTFIRAHPSVYVTVNVLQFQRNGNSPLDLCKHIDLYSVMFDESFKKKLLALEFRASKQIRFTTKPYQHDPFSDNQIILKCVKGYFATIVRIILFITTEIGETMKKSLRVDGKKSTPPQDAMKHKKYMSTPKRRYHLRCICMD